MNVLEIISRGLTNHNTDISSLKKNVSNLLESKQDKIFYLNTEALVGLTFTDYGFSEDLSEERLLSLFGVDTIAGLYSTISSKLGGKFITLKPLIPDGNSSIKVKYDYITPLSVSCCNAKPFVYGEYIACVLTFQCVDTGPNEYIFNFAFILNASEVANATLEIMKHVNIREYETNIGQTENKLTQKQDKRKLSILFIGNSLTQDGIAYLPYMLKTYYPEIDFNIYMWYIGGYTLEQHYSVFTSDGKANIFSVAENTGTWTNHSKTMTMKQVLSTYKFDIVSMQEYFNYKTGYDNATVWNNCRDYIVSNYTGGNALEFVSLFHAPLRASADTVFDVTCEGNAYILQNTISQDMIPNGIAVYRALETDLDVMGDKQHLSPDGTHTQEGLPCLMQTYVTLCWLFDRFGINKSVYGHPMRMTKAIYDTISVPGANLGTGVLTGTDAQNLLAQEMAIKAYKEGKQFTMRNLYPYEEKVIQCTFTINTNVEGATIKINGVETNTTVVMAGSTVYWDVLADGYHSQSGNEIVSIDTVKYVELMPVIDVASIDVDFTQGNRTIFTNMELNDFKRLLKVTAHYEDGTDVLVSDYALIGELNEGDNTITISYGGQSTSFNVNATEFVIPEGYQRYGYIENKTNSLGSKISKSNFIYLPAYEDYNSLSAEMILGEKQNVSTRANPGTLGARLASGAGYPYFGIYFQDQLSVMIRDIAVKVPYPSSTVKMKVYIDNPSVSPVTVQINNGTPVTGTWAESRVIPYGMSLFNCIPYGSTDGMYINYSSRIGDIMFRKEDGTCVGYFTPCVKDEVIGMYDQISQTFYTAENLSAVTATNSSCKYKVGNW